MADGFINATCGSCGHMADFDEFCRTAIFGDLPSGEHQCPACGYAFKRKMSDYKIYEFQGESLIIPGRVELVPVAGRL